jgi:hypothetical protein
MTKEKDDWKSVKVPDSLKKFKANPRQPRKSKAWKFANNANPGGGIEISKDGMTVTKISSTTHTSFTGDSALPRNRISKWRVHIVKLEATQWVMVGIAQWQKIMDQNSYSDSTNFGRSSANQRYQGSQSATNNMTFNFTTGDVLECMYNPKEHTYQMKVVQGSNQGREDTWTGLPDIEFVPHFNLYQLGNVIRIEPL